MSPKCAAVLIAVFGPDHHNRDRPSSLPFGRAARYEEEFIECERPIQGVDFAQNRSVDTYSTRALLICILVRRLHYPHSLDGWRESKWVYVSVFKGCCHSRKMQMRKIACFILPQDQVHRWSISACLCVQNRCFAIGFECDALSRWMGRAVKKCAGIITQQSAEVDPIECAFNISENMRCCCCCKHARGKRVVRIFGTRAHSRIAMKCSRCSTKMHNVLATC